MYGLMFNHGSRSAFRRQISDQMDSEALKMDLSQSDLRAMQEHMFYVDLSKIWQVESKV